MSIYFTLRSKATIMSINELSEGINEVSNKPDLQILPFESPIEFDNWLEQNHDNTKGIWLKFFKKNSGIKSIIYDEALDIALCYGWIDGQLKKYDENSYIQKFTPRRAKSLWSKRNIGKATSLEIDGKLKPSGIAEIERARMDRRWEKAYDSPGQMIVPEDFIQEISTNKKAFEFFKTLNKTNLYSLGWRLQTAKNTETRLKRMNSIIQMFEREEKFH